jgi:hypothetical protein
MTLAKQSKRGYRLYMVCTAKTKTGKDCYAKPMSGYPYCFRHNPDIPDDIKLQASTAGGKKRQVLNGADPVSIRNIEGIVSLLESNINKVRTGELDPKVNNAIVQNVNTLLKVYELAITDTRVRKLESTVGINSPDELVSLDSN